MGGFCYYNFNNTFQQLGKMLAHWLLGRSIVPTLELASKNIIIYVLIKRVCCQSCFVFSQVVINHVNYFLLVTLLVFIVYNIFCIVSCTKFMEECMKQKSLVKWPSNSLNRLITFCLPPNFFVFISYFEKIKVNFNIHMCNIKWNKIHVSQCLGLALFLKFESHNLYFG
jgi:hypothetical protein